MATLNALEHHATDFDKEVAFFRDVLGCPLTREAPGKMARFEVADGFSIVVFPRDDSHPPYGSFRGETVCLSVPNVDELAEELKSRGASIRLGPTTQPSGLRNFFLETPSGLTMEYGTRTS